MRWSSISQTGKARFSFPDRDERLSSTTIYLVSSLELSSILDLELTVLAQYGAIVRADDDQAVFPTRGTNHSDTRVLNEDLITFHLCGLPGTPLATRG